MSTQSILRELEQLRKTLDRCPCVSSTSKRTPSPPKCSCSCSSPVASPSRRHHDAPRVDQLAASAARLDALMQQSNDQLDADTRTVADTYRRSHQHKELEVSRLHTTLAAKDKVIDNLRDTLQATKDNMQEELSKREASLAQALASLSTTQTQLATAQGEAEALRRSLDRVTTRVHSTEAELLQALQGKQDAQATASKELETARAECKRMSSALEAAEARAAQLGREAEEAKAAAAAQRQERREQMAQTTRDLEQCIASLKQQVASERVARVAAEECYQAELRAHQQTEGLVLQLRQLLLQDEEHGGREGCGCAHTAPAPSGCTEGREPATEATLRRLASDNRHVREEVQAIKSMIHNELSSTSPVRAPCRGKQETAVYF